MTAPFFTNVSSVPTHRWDAEQGRVSFQTLFSADQTPSKGMVLGKATLKKGDVLMPHFHPEDEFYFCLSGSGKVLLNNEIMDFKAGDTLFIPGNTEHGVWTEKSRLTFLYGFSCDSFSDVNYTFTGRKLPF